MRWQTIAPTSRNCVVICLLGMKINNWNWKRYFFASANVKTSGFISWEDQIPMWRNQLKAFLNFIWLFVLANLQQKRERLMHCCLRCTLMWQPGENIEGKRRLRFFFYTKQQVRSRKTAWGWFYSKLMLNVTNVTNCVNLRSNFCTFCLFYSP